jgi:hypothetical protein
MMGPHERAALQSERQDLLLRPNRTQMEGRRLDEIEKLLRRERPYPDNLTPLDPGYIPSIDG